MRRRRGGHTPPKRTTKHRWTCPLCDGEQKLDATYKRDFYGRWRWFIGCFSANCPEGPEYLAALADVVGARPWQILEDPIPWLEHLGSCSSSLPTPAPLPSIVQIEGWNRALLTDKRALHYVTRQRGLTRQTIRNYLLGFDGQAIVIPVIAPGRRVLNVRRRFLRPRADGPKIIGVRGYSAHLFPGTIRRRAFVLCEGEFDALVARQHGLPAVTSTAGTSWSQSWNRYAARRRIAVLYDAGQRSFRLACKRAAALVSAGAENAWAVDLRRAGLANGEDLTDWFVTYGFSTEKLLTLIRQSRQDGSR